MRCGAANGYAHWDVREITSGNIIDMVLWVDPDEKSYCTLDIQALASTTHVVKDVTVDCSAVTFWITKLPINVAPLSPGRQQPQPATDKPCDACRQEATCRRIGYCAAYRCAFGEVDKP